MEVRTCAILYNASFDLLNVNLQNKYKFEKRDLGDIQLIDFFDETLFGFRRKYQEACLDEDLNVITVESNFNINNEESFDSNSDKSLIETELFIQLDRQIRLIRLVCNCSLHFSEFRYIITSSTNSDIKGTIPNVDRKIDKVNQPFSISDKQYEQIENCICSSYLFNNEWVQKVYDFFDSSFLLNDEKALVILITAFEMVFLKRDRYKMKEILAKRSAVYFGNSDAEILEIYEKMKLCYSDRSNYVHEGKLIQDLESKLHFLRNLLRKFILDNKENSTLDKSAFIQEQISKVENCSLFSI